MDIWAGRTNKSKVADLKRNNGDRDDITTGRLDIGEIHQCKIAAVVFVALNTLVIVKKIAAAIEDQPVAVDLDTFGMMR